MEKNLSDLLPEPAASRLGRIVAFGNQKGGVGKTTTTFNLATALAERGRKVLVWDLDVNCGATRLAGITADIPIGGTFEVMLGDEQPADVIITAEDDEGLNLHPLVNLLPAHAKLEGIEAALTQVANPFDTTSNVLTKPLAQLKSEYDYIFLDTSPSMTPPTKAAHLSAPFFVIAAVPDKLAVEGLVQAIKYLSFARKGGNPDLQLMGVVMSMVPGRATKVSRYFMEQAAEALNSAGDAYGRLFDTHIQASTVVQRCQQENTLLFEVEREHRVTQQYLALATELEERFALWDAEHAPATGSGAGSAGAAEGGQ